MLACTWRICNLAKRLVSNNGAIQIADTDSLEDAVAELLRDVNARKRLVQNARAAINEHQGATARTAALVHELQLTV